MTKPVVIVGGGLAGLTCAKQLHDAGVEFQLVEASDQVGGRVRTDEVDGFLLDRGFQVLLTAYPEAVGQLDYDQLDLRIFEPGALIRSGDSFQRMSDPWRRPQYALQTAFSSVGSFVDKLRIGRLRWSARRGTVESIFSRADVPTINELRRLGFSDCLIEGFLRPFLGGVFLDTDLETSCRMLYFVFRMFSQGDIALPAAGMGAIPAQLANDLPADSILLNSPVDYIDGGRVTLQSGEVIEGRQTVIAVEQSAASRLLPELGIPRKPRTVQCVYFSAAEAPIADRMLVLNGAGTGPVNNLCVPSQITSTYAPADRALVSATVLKPEPNSKLLESAIRQQMREWFGNSVDEWQHLQTYDIPNALPNQTSPAFDPAVLPAKVRDDVYVCGDYRTNGSINGAMQSGRLIAEEIIGMI